MKASDLSEEIYIYEEVTTRTSTGSVSVDYALKYTTRARVNYSSGIRTISNDEIFYSVDREFIVRSYVPVVVTDEIRWNGQRWQVQSIDKSTDYNNIVIKTTLLNE